MRKQQEQSNLPPPIVEFVNAINRHNTTDVLQTLGENIVITDEGQEYRGIEEARTWCDEKCVAVKVTLRVVDMNETDDEAIVAFEIDGSFDKSGLPDPFVMNFHFTIADNKVVELFIRLPGV